MLVRRRLLRFVGEAPLSVTATVLLALAASACAIGQGFALAEALRRGFAGDDPAELVAPVALTGLLLATRAVLLWGRDLAATRTALTVKRRLRRRLTGKLTELGPGYAATRHSGTLQATVADGVEALPAYVGFYLPQAAVSLIGPAVIVALLWQLDPVVGLAVGLCVLAVPLSRTAWARLLGERGRAHWVAYERFAARIHDALQGMTTLKSLGAGARYGRRLEADAQSLYRATMGNLAASTGVFVLTGFLMSAGTALAVALAAFRTAQGHLDAAALLIVLFLAAECFRPLHELQGYWHEGFTGLAAGNGIVELLDAEPPVTDPAAPRPAPASADGVDLRFERVTFGYPGSGEPAVREVDLHVPAGSTLALVGRSGAGKTTLVQLLTRFFDPDAGAVRAGGTDLREMALADVRALTAVVSQDTHLFHGTVADNLRFAAPDADDARLEAAARAARIHDVIRRLPDGYETVIGERGSTLSGGERQRLAIARALLKDAPVLVLDEATASVDGRTEAELRAAVEQVRRGRTTVIIAHRLSTVADADQVAVLDGGRVLECGPPAGLRFQDGAWSRLIDAHSLALEGR